MKRILFFACTAGVIIAASPKSDAQAPQWGSTGTPTYTTTNAGIGLAATQTDSRFKIAQTVHTNITQFSAQAIPDVKIGRAYPDATASVYFTVDPNYLEIWKSDYYNPTPALNFVVTSDFRLGVGLSAPAYKLDVAGTLHCSSDATVGGDIYISHSNDALWRNIFANASGSGLALYSKSTTYDGPAIMMTGNSASSYAGDMRFFDGSGSTSRFVFGKPSGGSANGTMVEQVVIDGNGDISMPRDNDASWRVVNGKADHGALVLKGADDGSGTIELYGGGHTDRPGRIQFICDDAGEDPDGLGFNFINYDPVNTWQSRMRIYKNGKVAIGTESMNVATSYDYGLYVEKGVLTSRLKVAVTNSTEWSDYVFADNYKLKPLSEVASYIGSNKHLPGVPSADDVVKNGVDMAQMDATLLKKIEELTLYSIQQQKQIDQLQSQVKALVGASANEK